MRRVRRIVRRMIAFVLVGGVLAMGGLVLAAPGVSRNYSGPPPQSGNPFDILWWELKQLAGRVDQLATDIGSLATRVGELIAWSGTDTQRVDSLNQLYTDLNNKVTALDGKVTTLDGKVATFDGKIATLDGKVATFDGKIATIDGKVAALDGKVTTVEGKVAILDGNVTTLDGKVTSVSVGLAGLTSSVGALSQSVEGLKTRMDQLDATSMVVVDSMGAKVGDFVGFSGTDPNMVPLVGMVAQTSNGTHPFVLQLFPDRLIGNPLFFSEPNCLPGTAYVKHTSFAGNAKSALSLAAVTAPGMLVWVTDAGVPPELTPLVTPKSTVIAGNCTNFAVPQVATRALPVVLQVDLNPHFVPPFAVQ